MLTDEKVITGIYNKLKALINKSAIVNLRISGDNTEEDVTYKFLEFIDYNGFTKDLTVCINGTVSYNIEKNYYNNNLEYFTEADAVKSLYNIEEIDRKPALYKYYIKIFSNKETSCPISIHLGRVFVRMLD